MNILIVDDSKLNVMVAKVLLEDNMDESLYTAYSAKEAFAVIKEVDIDLILLDIHMPIMSGIEFLDQIKNDNKYKHIDVIMLTSVDLEEQIEECFSMGAMDYIIKPIKEKEYLARVKSALREIDLKKELKNTNEKLMNSQSQLIQQQKMVGIGQLAAGIAHEINNPLGFIMSNIETLENYYKDVITALNNIKIGTEIDEDDLKYVIEDSEIIFDESKEGLQRISKIVKELRYFSAIDFSDGYKEYNINDSVESILTLIHNKLGENIVLVKNLHEVSTILALNDKFNQVIMNILFNAISAIEDKEESKGFIEIKTFEVGDIVSIQIFDDGIGIPKENLDKIFNPFFTTKPVGKGIGLGLSSAYNTINNLHGGNIIVESEVGIGTKFTIQMPKNKSGVANG